jgi:hypothetical protein
VEYDLVCFPIHGWKRGHLVGNRIELLLEEDGEVAGDDIVQEDGGRHVKTSEVFID